MHTITREITFVRLERLNFHHIASIHDYTEHGRTSTWPLTFGWPFGVDDRSLDHWIE